MEAFEVHADVDGDDVALLDHVGPRYAMDDDVVRRRADGAREAPVALERGHGSCGADHFLGYRVELLRRGPGPEGGLDTLERPHEDVATPAHRCDLFCGFLIDHGRRKDAQIEVTMREKTSSGDPSPLISLSRSLSA